MKHAAKLLKNFEIAKNRENFASNTAQYRSIVHHFTSFMPITYKEIESFCYLCVRIVKGSRK